jgi:hypothetical protein
MFFDKKEEVGMSEGLSSVLWELDLDRHVVDAIVKLISTGSYDECFGELVNQDCFWNNDWEPIALAHRLVVAWQPGTAEVWLKHIAELMCQQKKPVWAGFYEGTIVGLLEAAVKLDRGLYQTEFQKHLLTTLIAILFESKLFPSLSSRGGFGGGRQIAQPNERLTNGLKKFLTPTKSTHILTTSNPDPLRPDITEQDMQERRATQTVLAISVLRELYLGQSKLTEFQELFVERLVGPVLGRQSLFDRLRASEFLLKAAE